MKKFNVQRTPFLVPTDDGKIIEEHFGLASIPGNLSIAKMIAPPGWSEPFQTPEFDEYTFVIEGRKQFVIENETVVMYEDHLGVIERLRSRGVFCSVEGYK